MFPLADLYLNTAIIYVVICVIYFRRKHGWFSRYTLALAALLLALIAFVRSDFFHNTHWPNEIRMPTLVASANTPDLA